MNATERLNLRVSIVEALEARALDSVRRALRMRPDAAAVHWKDAANALEIADEIAKWLPTDHPLSR